MSFRIVCNIDFDFGLKTSGSQVHYLSSTNEDGTDDYCEVLGLKRLQEYNPEQRRWKYLTTLAEGSAMLDEELPFEDEEEDEEDYYPSLPFAALYCCFKVLFISYIVAYGMNSNSFLT